eukprot:6115673-Pyramimonas_sp.AAC.1
MMVSTRWAAVDDGGSSGGRALSWRPDRERAPCASRLETPPRACGEGARAAAPSLKADLRRDNF